MGLIFAQVLIGLWFPITFYLFKRYPAPRAALYAVLAGLLLLPNWAGIKIPLFPEIEKSNVVGLAMIAVLAFAKPKGLNPRVEPWWYVAAIGLFVSLLLTAFTNQDAIYFPGTGALLPGHGFKDAGYVVLSTMLGPVPASYMGLRMFRKVDDLRTIVRTLTLAGLIYTVPVLIELRFSPQVHRWIYGYAGTHEWTQTIRYGGYRPLVMLSHGLVLSLFMFLPTMTATAMARTGGRIWRLSTKNAAWYMTAILVACKSTGVWAYALIGLPMVRWAKAKWMLRLAMAMCLLTCLYPWLRANEMLPLEDLLEKAGQLGEDREGSLRFRFNNEDILLEKAMDRPWFGWGSYGRNRVYDEDGVDICVTDGAWILTLGSFGFAGGAFVYMFTVLPLFIAGRRTLKVRDAELRNMLAALILALSFMWFDTLPNAPDFTLVQFFAGALCSISYTIVAEQERSGGARPRRERIQGRPSETPESPAKAS